MFQKQHRYNKTQYSVTRNKEFIIFSYSNMFRLVIEPSSGLNADIKKKILTTKIRIILCTKKV
jgi:hypothetical protein